MNAKKILIMAMVCSLFVVFGTSAFAGEWGWYECTVTHAGVLGDGHYRIILNGTKMRGSATVETIDRKFDFHPDLTKDTQKLMYATILTALSTGSKVEALVDPTERVSLYALIAISN